MIKNDYKLAPILLETLKRFEDSGVNLYRIDESNLDKSKHKSSIIIESKNKHRIFSTQGYKYNSRGRDLEGFYLDLVPRKDDCREFEDQFNAIIRNTSCEIVNKDIIKEFETDLNIMNEALQKKKNKAE